MMQTPQRNENLMPGEIRGWWPKPQFESKAAPVVTPVDTRGWWRRPELQKEPSLTPACQG